MKSRLSFLLCLFLSVNLVCDGSDKPLEPIKLPSVESFSTPSESEIARVGEWLATIESNTLADDKVLMLLNVEHVSSAREGGADHLAATQMSLIWAEDFTLLARRWISQRQNLLADDAKQNAIAQAENFRVDSSSYADQLKVKRIYHESVGASAAVSRDKAKLTVRIKRMGMCHPVGASLSNATDIYSGTAVDIGAQHLTRDRLAGIAVEGDLSHYLWKYGKPGDVRLNRLITFRDQVPIQVEFRIAPISGKSLGLFYGRTRSRWREHPKLGKVPTHIHAMVDFRGTAFELNVDVEWYSGSEVPQALFNPNTVGLLPATKDVLKLR